MITVKVMLTIALCMRTGHGHDAGEFPCGFEVTIVITYINMNCTYKVEEKKKN